jgi:hypothetical protein
LQVALGRPNREQVVPARATVATTLQALEMTNGSELAGVLRRGAETMLQERPDIAPKTLARQLWQRALLREPTRQELQVALELLGQPVRPQGLEDLFWALVMLPEFQLIY